MTADKYTFRREYTDLYGQKKTVEHTMEGETLPEILEDFLYFLNGCSFTYVKDLIFVKETGEEVGVIEWEQDIRDTETSDDLINEIDILVEKMNNASGQ